MKLLLLSIYLFIGAKLAFSQAAADSMMKIHSIIANVSTDSINIKQDTTTLIDELRKVVVTVNPRQANDAYITVIRKSKIIYDPNGHSEYQIIPDTVGIWTAPLLLSLELGTYDLVLRKEGFKGFVKEARIAKELNDSIAIEMYSLEYLQHKREQWRLVKWISAGVAVAAVVISFYVHNRIDTYKNEYDNAITASDIQDKRNSINSSRSYYRISSGIAFTAIGGYGISWLIESQF